MAKGITQRWIFYALGGGLGHLTRAIALARGVLRWGKSEGRALDLRVLTNSPFASLVNVSAELGHGHRVVAFRPSLNREETAARTVGFLKATRCDVLVVDTFPRGLCGELAELLPELNCRKVLVHRDLNPRYIQQANLLQWIDHFDQLILPGESAPFGGCSHAIRTQPWLIRDAHEFHPTDLARRRLGVEVDSVPIVAVLGSGKIHEVDQMRQLAWQLAKDFESSVAVRLITPRPLEPIRRDDARSNLATVHLWPFLPDMRAASVVVGGGGYNTVQETRATQTPFVGCPQPRLYDRQRRRLKPDETALNPDEVRERVSAALEQDTSHARSQPRYENGVHQAVAHIAKCIDAIDS